MRSFSHWTPAYMLARSREIIDHKLHPHNPWLTAYSVKLLSSLLRPTDVMLELGAGRSTPWFARRVRHVTTVEDDPAWYAKVKDGLAANGIENVELVLVPRRGTTEDEHRSKYVDVIRAAC